MSGTRGWLGRLAVVVLASVSTACSATPLSSVEISGRVVDIETGKPVVGAYVLARSGRKEFCPAEAGGCSCVLFNAAVTRTGENGHYSFDQRFHFGALPGAKFGFVRVYAPGFATAPAWISQHWEEASTSTLAEHVAGYIPAQYFYGTGDYHDAFQNLRLAPESDTYYLTRRPIAGWDPKAPRDVPAAFDSLSAPAEDDYTPRVLSLFDFANTLGGTACEYDEEDVDYEAAVFPILRAIYHEAARFAKTKKDFEYLHRICMEAKGLSWPREADKPCKLSAASKQRTRRGYVTN